MKPYIKHIASLIVLFAPALISTSAHAQDVEPAEIHHQGNISYVSGGISVEEVNALKAVKKDYNLYVMSSDVGGHFTGEFHIVVKDAADQVLLDTQGGPLFYAALPAGKYTIEGTAMGISEPKKQNFTITTGKTANVHFIWPEDAPEEENKSNTEWLSRIPVKQPAER